MKVLNDNIMLKRTKTTDITTGGIFLPETTQDKPTRGIVIGVGNGKITGKGRVPISGIEVGDEVFFKRYQEREIEIKGEKFLFLHAEDIIGVIV